jgi:hypothetical protein
LEEGVLRQQKTLSSYFCSPTSPQIRYSPQDKKNKTSRTWDKKTTAKLGTKSGVERVRQILLFFELWLNFPPDVSIRNSAGIISSWLLQSFSAGIISFFSTEFQLLPTELPLEISPTFFSGLVALCLSIFEFIYIHTC